MKWKKISSLEHISQLSSSTKDCVLLFKHSTRCPVSFAALKRIEKHWQQEDYTHMRPYLINVIKERLISNEIAKCYEVEHASPQILLISAKHCVYTASHEAINYTTLRAALEK